MFLTKLKLTGAVLFGLCLLCTGTFYGRAALAQQSGIGADQAVSTSAPAVQLVNSVVTKQERQAHSHTDPNAALEQSVTVGFDEGTRLSDALELISDKYDLTIVFNNKAFEQIGRSKPRDEIQQAKVRLPKMVDVKLREVLPMLLDQANADYLVRDQMMVIVPQDWVKSAMAIRQLVDVNFEHASLTHIVDVLARRSGASIVVDERVAKIADEPMSVRMQRVPLVTAVAVLADTKSLHAVAVGNLIYVTSRQNAEEFEAKQAPALRKVEPYYALPVRPPATGVGHYPVTQQKQREGKK